MCVQKSQYRYLWGQPEKCRTFGLFINYSTIRVKVGLVLGGIGLCVA